MKISLSDTGKKYRNEWVFKGVHQDFDTGEKWLIKGSNGSGKSTFVKVLSGFTSATKGSILYQDKKFKDIHKNFSIAAPYLQLPESFTLRELIDFQKQFKPFVVSSEEPEPLFDLPLNSKSKKIEAFSSGMLQRVKLGLAILSDVPVLILDEPVSNLDAKGINWYQQMVEDYATDKLILVCSNAIKDEYAFCDQEFNIEDYK